LVIALIFFALTLINTVPINRVNFAPLNSVDGYVVFSDTGKIELSGTADAIWRLDNKNSWIYGYSGDSGIKCMSNLDNLSVQDCKTNDNFKFQLLGNKISSGDKCVVKQDNGILVLGNCANALVLI